ncbi:helix-turn-helix transcriptional regulator [Sulfitobacter sp. S190]|nr:helix-turn-helix transcriptional regulator [Sulfitobacter sp. S190]
MFSANLRTLVRGQRSISQLSRQLGINRTQFNRYLSGESFPRPDVLARICDFFDIDARVLLEPIDSIRNTPPARPRSFLGDFVGAGIEFIAEEHFPTGFYRTSRRSFEAPDRFVLGLVHVCREGASTYVRGYDNAQAMAQAGLPHSPHAREFRGAVAEQDEGLTILATRRGALGGTMSYLRRVASFENNYWLGYAARTVPEGTRGIRVTRLVHEFLGTRIANAIAARRTGGLMAVSELPEFHHRLLQPSHAFR